MRNLLQVQSVSQTIFFWCILIYELVLLFYCGVLLEQSWSGVCFSVLYVHAGQDHYTLCIYLRSYTDNVYSKCFIYDWCTTFVPCWIVDALCSKNHQALTWIDYYSNHDLHLIKIIWGTFHGEYHINMTRINWSYSAFYFLKISQWSVSLSKPHPIS